MKWISVKKKMPDYYTTVLVILASKDKIIIPTITIAWLASDGDKFIWTRQFSDDIIDISHWMPLPKIPKKI